MPIIAIIFKYKHSLYILISPCAFSTEYSIRTWTLGHSGHHWLCSALFINTLTIRIQTTQTTTRRLSTLTQVHLPFQQGGQSTWPQRSPSTHPVHPFQGAEGREDDNKIETLLLLISYFTHLYLVILIIFLWNTLISFQICCWPRSWLLSLITVNNQRGCKDITFTFLCRSLSSSAISYLAFPHNFRRGQLPGNHKNLMILCMELF